MITIQSLDHLVLTVEDIQLSCTFYKNVLGMKCIEFKPGRFALTFGPQKINLHQAGNEIKPHANYPTRGSADLCFLTRNSIEEILQHLDSLDIQIEEGPVERTGAQGNIMSVYIRDPDGNLLEIATQ